MKRGAAPVCALTASALILWGANHEARTRSSSGQGSKDPVTLPYKWRAIGPSCRPAGLWAWVRGSRPMRAIGSMLCIAGTIRSWFLIPSGKLLQDWGDGMFCWPHGIRVDADGNIWIIDGGAGSWPTPDCIPGKGHVVLKFSPAGKLLMTLGKQGEPGNDSEHFNGPTDVAFAPNGDFYVADGYGNARVVKFSRNGKYIRAWGRKGTGDGEFNLPHAIVVDPRGLVYVADRENFRIQIFDGNGKFIKQWKGVGRPIGLALGHDGYFHVADTNGQRILKLSAEGVVLGVFGSKGNEPGQTGRSSSYCRQSGG